MRKSAIHTRQPFIENRVIQLSRNLCHTLTHSFVETQTSFSGSRIIINSNEAESEAENQPDNGHFVIVWGKSCSGLKQTTICAGKPTDGVIYRASTFTRINGNVSFLCDKRLQNLHIV